MKKIPPILLFLLLLMSYLWSPGLTPSSVQQTNECWNTIRLTLNRSRNRLDVWSWPWPVLSLGSWIKILNLWFVVSLYGKSCRLMKLGCNKSHLGPCRGSQMLSDVSRQESGWWWSNEGQDISPSSNQSLDIIEDFSFLMSVFNLTSTKPAHGKD